MRSSPRPPPRRWGFAATAPARAAARLQGTIALQFARVRTMRIGKAELTAVPGHPLSGDVLRPREREGADRRNPGSRGLRALRDPARLAAQTITLTRLDAYRHHGPTHAIPIVFQDDMPLATARADGHPGLFGIDTGNSGTLILFGDFLRHTGLRVQYPDGKVAVASGTGGEDARRIRRCDVSPSAARR